MKRNFLLMLLMTLLPLAGWAVPGVTLTGLTTFGSEKVYLVGDNAALPGAKIGETAVDPTDITFFDAQSKPVTAITKVGWYFAQVVNGETTVTISFKAVKTLQDGVNYDVVFNKQSFDEALGRGLGAYLTANPEEDHWNYEQVRFGMAKDQTANDPVTYPATVPQNWYGAIYAPGAKAPWVHMYFPTTATDGLEGKVVFKYAYEAGERMVTPWGDNIFGAKEGQRHRGMASLAAEFNDDTFLPSRSSVGIFTNNNVTSYWLDGAVPSNWPFTGARGTQDWPTGADVPTADDYEKSDNPTYPNFDVNNLSVYLIPAQETAPTFYEWSLSPSTVAYDGTEYYNTEQFKGFFTFGTEGTAAPDFTYKVYVGEQEVTSVKAARNYTVKVFIDNVEIGEAKPFSITAYTLTVGSSVSYKQFGDPDPLPNYSILYLEEASNLKINGLKLVRKDSDPKDDVVGGKYEYYIDMTTATVTDLDDNLNPNYKIGTSSVTGVLEVTKKVVDASFKVEVNDANLVYDGTAKTPAFTVKRDKNYGIEGATTQDWEDVTAQFEVVEGGWTNNTNADADKDGNWLKAAGERASVTVTPKANGNFTTSLQTVVFNNEQITVTTPTEPNPLFAEFKIRQANIANATVTLATTSYVFGNDEKKPVVTVTYNNKEVKPGVAADAESKEGAVYVYSYTGNKYVNDGAKAIVEAYPYTESEGVKTYTGNFYGKNETATFTINPFVFTLKPKDHVVAVGDDEEDYDATDGFVVIGVPAESMGEGATMPQDVADIATWTKPVNRIAGTGVGVYPIQLKGAALKTEPLVTGNAKSAPSNNYQMTPDNGIYEITKAEGVFFVSSKKIEKVYDGQATIASTQTPGYYLYKKTGEGNSKADYTEVDPASNLFKMIVGPTQHVAREGNFNSEQGKVAGRDVRNNPNDSWWIMPVVDGLSTEDYTLQVMPRTYSDYTGGNNFNQHEGEGFCLIKARDVVLVANDQTSEFGEAIVTPLTATAYEKSTAAGADNNGLLKNADGEIQNAVLPATLAAEIRYNLSARGRFGNNTRNLRAGDPVRKDYTVEFFGNQPNVSSNYNVTRVNGVYEITESSKRIRLTAAGAKGYGEADADATWTVTAQLGKGTEFADYTGTIPTVFTQATSYERASATDTGEDAGSTHNMNFIRTTGTEPAITVVCPEKINGYIVDYNNSTAVLTINKAGELVLTAANQIIEYGMLPQVGANVSAPYLKINGHKNDLDKIKAKLVVAYPESGLIKNGATINIEYDETYVNANYTTVTVKPAKLTVNAANEITLNRAPAAEKAPIAESYADIVKADAPKNNALQTIKDYDGVEGVTVKFAGNVDMYYDKWYAMVLPFETSVKAISSAFGYAVVELLDMNSDRIHFKIQMNKIPANTPFIVKVMDDDPVYDEATGKYTSTKKLDNVVFEGKTIVYNADPSVLNTKAQVKFIGTYEGKTGFAANEYFFSMSANADPEKYYYGSATNSTYLRPLGSYIQDLIGNGVREIIIEEPDGTITAINGVAEDGSLILKGGDAEGWYTIDGKKLNASPTQKGIYIQNGKKVLVK